MPETCTTASRTCQNVCLRGTGRTVLLIRSMKGVNGHAVQLPSFTTQKCWQLAELQLRPNIDTPSGGVGVSIFNKPCSIMALWTCLIRLFVQRIHFLRCLFLESVLSVSHQGQWKIPKQYKTCHSWPDFPTRSLFMTDNFPNLPAVVFAMLMWNQRDELDQAEAWLILMWKQPDLSK